GEAAGARRQARRGLRERLYQLDRDRAVEAFGRRDAGEAVGADVDRGARLELRRAQRLARGRAGVDERCVALAVDDAVAQRDEAPVERDARVGRVDLAARRAADAQPVALDLTLRLQRLAAAAARLGDDEQLQGAATSR